MSRRTHDMQKKIVSIIHLSRAARFRFAASVALLSLSPVAHAQSANDAQVEQAKILLTQERFIEALAVAKDATRIDGSDYRAHYYVAMAYMGLRQFDAAETEANDALAKAPDSARPAVEKLAGTIRSLRQGTTSVSDADTALSEGLIGKAARLFEEGWNSGRNAPDFAFKAADLYANRLNQPIDAARVLRQVQQAMPGSAAYDQAETELKKISPTLRQIATARVAEARTLDWSRAAPVLTAAEEADPTYSEIYLTRATLAGASGSAELMESAIKDLARRNLINLQNLQDLPNIGRMMQQADFAQFMADVIGSQQAQALAEATSPAGSMTLLANAAAQGKINFFTGAKQSGTSYYMWSRRMVTAVQAAQPGAQCQSTLFLGDVVNRSEDVSVKLNSRIVDWRKISKPAIDGDFVALGPNEEGWVMTGFGVINDPQMAQRVFQAVATLYAACMAAPSSSAGR